MRLTNRQLRAFLECPAYYYFSKDIRYSSVSDQVRIVEDIVKKCCLQAVETGWKADWRRVIGWVDREVFKDVDPELEYEETFEEAKKLAEHVLKPIQRWYNSFYLDMTSECYVDVDLNHELRYGDFIEARAPVIHLAMPPSITLVMDVDDSERKMYNNLEIRALAFLLHKQIECGPVQINALQVGPNGGLEQKMFTIAGNSHRRTEKVIGDIFRSIQMNISYPSRTEKCPGCPYFRRCQL